MISVMASGTLISAPTKRTSRNGNDFVTAQLKAFDGDESSLVSLVAFDELICKSMLALSKGDALVVSGSGTASTWTGRDGSQCLGLNVVVKVLMTQYAVSKKRKASLDMDHYGLPAQSPLEARENGGTIPMDFNKMEVGCV